jgi:surface antigen
MRGQRWREIRGTALLLALAGLGLGACETYGERYSSTFEEALDPADRRQMIETAQTALENNKSGESANWSNPDTDHLGTVMPVRTFDADSGAPCREYQQTVTVEGKTGVAHETACREPDGTWKIRSSPNPAGVAVTWKPPGYRAADYDYGYPYYGHGYLYGGYPYPYYGHRYPYYGHHTPYSVHLGYRHYFGY